MIRAEIFLERLPKHVFPDHFQVEIYRYDDVFFTDSVDTFFDALEVFAKVLGEDKLFVTCLSGCYEPNEVLVDNLNINGRKLVDFTFARDFEEFLIFGQSAKWGIYCHRAVEWIMFGADRSVEGPYRKFSESEDNLKLKYETIEAAVNNVPISLARLKKNEFADQIARAYGDR